MPAPRTWPDHVDEILAGDQAVMLGYCTPARGVVLAPVTNFAARDRVSGTVTVNSSVGAWRKLDRIRRNPHVALAFHTRAHATTDRPEYVLVQGTAALSAPVADYPAAMGPDWERFDGPRAGPRWDRWLRVYHTRVSITVTAHRVVVWADLACRGVPAVHGAALRTDPPVPQRPPAQGSGPRVDHARAAARLARLPNRLLGWIGADELPVVVPVGIAGTESDGILLDVPPGWAAPGGRRAGLTAHSFTRYVTGQHQRLHTGWLAVDASGRARYAPHTERGHRLPPSPLLYRLAVGAVTRAQVRSARQAGLLDERTSRPACLLTRRTP